MEQAEDYAEPPERSWPWADPPVWVLLALIGIEVVLAVAVGVWDRHFRQPLTVALVCGFIVPTVCVLTTGEVLKYLSERHDNRLKPITPGGDMCMVSSDILDKLDRTVRLFLDQGRMFTGYDVTVETRERERMRLRHQDVNADIHELDALKDALDYGWDTAAGQTLQWARAQVNMPGGGWAWVYHPTTLDPKGYTPRQGGQPTQSQPQAPAMASISAGDGSTTDSGGVQADGTYAPDFRNRLMIPKKFLAEAGIDPGDEVVVQADPSTRSILLAKVDGLAGAIRVTTQTVERNGDIRLSSRTLKAGNADGSKFVIETADRDASGRPVKAVAVTPA